MRTICVCGQAVKLPDKPGRYACPKCRQPLAPVQAAEPAPAPVAQIIPDDPPKSETVKDWKKAGAFIGGGFVLLLVVLAIARGKDRPTKDRQQQREEKKEAKRRAEAKEITAEELTAWREKSRARGKRIQKEIEDGATLQWSRVRGLVFLDNLKDTNRHLDKLNERMNELGKRETYPADLKKIMNAIDNCYGTSEHMLGLN